MAAVDTTPYWSTTARIARVGSLSGDLKADVVVIGGGITGLTTAYLLTKAGAKVAVLERARFAGADTGHTSAHLTCITDLRLGEMVKTFGRNHAQAAWDAGLAAINRIHQVVEEERLECGFAWVPGYLHASQALKRDREQIASLERDARLAAEMGFDATFLDRVPLMDCPGIRFANQARFHPRKYLAGLLEVLRKKGCHLFEQSEISEVEVDPPESPELQPTATKASMPTANS